MFLVLLPVLSAALGSLSLHTPRCSLYSLFSVCQPGLPATEISVHDSRPKIIHHKQRFIDAVRFNLTPFANFGVLKLVTVWKLYYSCREVISTLMLDGDGSRDLCQHMEL